MFLRLSQFPRPLRPIQLARRTVFTSKVPVPPSHFGNSDNIPQPYVETESSNQNSNSSTPPPPAPASSERLLKDLGILLAVSCLAYIALDSYTQRLKTEKLVNETTAINLKTLQVQKMNFAKQFKKRDLQVLQERRAQHKRNYRMSLHIALLRKQLLENGVDPVDVDAAIREFDKSVKAETSIQNVNGQAFWLDDDNGTLH